VTTETDDIKPVKKTKLAIPALSKISTFLAMVIAVMALLISGRLFYNHYQDQEMIETLNARAEEQQAYIDETKAALAKQTEAVNALTKTVSEISAQFSNGQQGDALKRYHLVDTKHFITLANQVLLFERDAPKAFELLEYAKQSLSQISDPALADVSTQLNSDIEALKAVKVVDVNNLYTQLNALIVQADTLSITPELKFVPDDNSGKAQENISTLDNVLNWLGQYIKVKKHNQVTTPLLTPEEAGYVKHNIIVLLEQTQWGLLRGEPLAYQSGLERAEKLVQQYAVKTDSVTAAFLESITQLKAVDVAPALPDISKSLPLLEKVTTVSGSP
jgi:uroporphyrin-3 C-methyltransferase